MEADHQYQEVPQNSISNNMEVRQLKHGHSSELENDKYSYQREVLQLTQELELKVRNRLSYLRYLLFQKRHIEWTCERLSQTEKNLHLTQEALLKSHEKTVLSTFSAVVIDCDQ